MAADATANWPLTAPPGAPGRAFLPRVAIRTPATEARSIPAAREFTAATVRRWGAAERCDDITVVMSELLTNALRHALPDPATEMPRHPIRLGLLQLSHHLLCAVADPCSKPPVPAQPCGLAENGRGLHVIAALADSWGSTPPSRTGKIVWALFTLDHHGALEHGWIIRTYFAASPGNLASDLGPDVPPVNDAGPVDSGSLAQAPGVPAASTVRGIGQPCCGLPALPCYLPEQ